MAEPVHPSGSSEVKCQTTWGWNGLKMSLYTNNSVLCESFCAVSSTMGFFLSCLADTFNTQHFSTPEVSSTTPGLISGALACVQSKSSFKYSLMDLCLCCSALYLSKVLKPTEEIQYRTKNSSYLQLIALKGI